MCLVCCILARQGSLLLITSVSGSRTTAVLLAVCLCKTSELNSSNEIGHVEFMSASVFKLGRSFAVFSRVKRSRLPKSINDFDSGKSYSSRKDLPGLVCMANSPDLRGLFIATHI